MLLRRIIHRERFFDLSLVQYARYVKRRVEAHNRAHPNNRIQHTIKPLPDDQLGRPRARISVGFERATPEVTAMVVGSYERTRITRISGARRLRALLIAVFYALVVATLVTQLGAPALGASVMFAFVTLVFVYLLSVGDEVYEQLFAMYGDIDGVPLVRSLSLWEPARPPALASALSEVDKALLNAPRVSIAEHVDGHEGKIVARVRHADHVVYAPLSKRPCAYYELRVYEISGLMGVLRQREPFVIEDETGALRVEPMAAQLSVEVDCTREYAWTAIPMSLREMLRKLYSEEEVRRRDAKPPRHVWISEGVIEDGEEVAAMGPSILQPDPDAAINHGGYRAQPPDRRALVHSDRAPLLVSDNPQCRSA